LSQQLWNFGKEKVSTEKSSNLIKSIDF